MLAIWRKPLSFWSVLDFLQESDVGGMMLDCLWFVLDTVGHDGGARRTRWAEWGLVEQVVGEGGQV